MKQLGIFFVIVILTLAGCSDPDCINPSGKLVRESRPGEGFTSVAQDLPGVMTLSSGAEYKIEIEAHENIIGLVRTSVSDGELYIGSGSDLCNVTLNSHVTLPDPRSFRLDGAGDIRGAGNFSADTVAFATSGSGNISFDSFDAGVMSARITGTGQVAMKGAADSADVRIEGSGEIRLDSLKTRVCFYSLSGSGDIYAWATDTLRARVYGTGNIYYRGNPVRLDAVVTGTGEVIRLD
ncbi:MAG: head GIN domain-containing protein [Candidatus Kapaibacterium sp.]